MAQAQAQRRLPTPEKREVAFVVRAPDPNNRGRWITVGAAWERKGGQEGYNVRLNSVPVGAWDGALILLKPLPNGEVPEPEDQPQE